MPVATVPTALRPATQTALTSLPRDVTRPAERTEKHHRGLIGRWLLAARVAWLITAAVTFVLFAIALPVRATQLRVMLGNLSPAQQLVLQDWGVSVEQHARFVLAVEVLVPATFFAVGLLIFSRRSDEWVPMLVGLGLVTYSVWVSPPLWALETNEPAFRIPITLLHIVGMVTAASSFFVFPNGRFVPRWSILVVVACAAWGIGWLLLPGSLLDLSDPFRLPFPLFAASMWWWAMGIGCQVYRYTRTTSPVQRRQTKLVLFALVTGVAAYLVFGFDRFALPIFVGPRYASVVYDLIGVPIFQVITLVIPAAFAVSVLRYRLWEIDVIINRALVYGALTAFIAGLFPATLATCERLFTMLTGEKSDAVMIVLTLVFASTLTPLKNQLQTFVDRHVVAEPDPSARVRPFAERVRSVVEILDVDEITRRALDETLRAFRAASGAVYLYQQDHLQPAYVRGAWTQEEGMCEWLEHEGARYGFVALGPRADSVCYTEHDQEIFAQTTKLVARTMRLIQVGGFDHIEAAFVPVADRHQGGSG